jgi:hypothetical protein
MTGPVATAAPRPDTTGVGVWRGSAVKDLAAFAGRYYSQELDATYDVAVNGQALTVRRPRGEVDTLSMVDPQTFRANGLTYRFGPNVGDGRPGFTVDIGRASGMAFVKASGR